MSTNTDGSTYEVASFTKFLLADLYFILTTMYLLNCTIKGNDTYGYRFACFTFYPVTLNETLCSSFLVNAVIKNLVTASIMQLCVLQVPDYTRGSEIYLISQRTHNSAFAIHIGNLNIWSYVLLIFIFVTIVALIFGGSGRVSFKKEDEHDKN